jgi:hypothetical protein
MATVTAAATARRLLIVSPHFPPANAPDMQRVRMSLPYFREFGWEPHVLAVDDSGDAPSEPLLLATVPGDVPVERVKALPPAVTRLVGIGNIALRALPNLYRAGARIITREQIDLVYFSTTMFLSMPLGRLWQSRFGTPFVLDMQDPWLSDYYETHADVAPPPKYGMARRLHAVLEPWTMRAANGLIAVSDAYIGTLARRYPWLSERASATIPFAASQTDFELLDHRPQPQRIFSRGDGTLHAVSVGRGGDDLRPALEILFNAVHAAGTASTGGSVRSLRLHFVGTDYAKAGAGRQTVRPVAAACGMGEVVTEQSDRVPYFEALQLMKDADLLVLVGSDDPGYTASKVYPYLLSRKPLLAVVHESSPLVPLLRRAATALITFTEYTAAAATEHLTRSLPELLGKIGDRPVLAPEVELACSAREMTRRQCQLFDRILGEAAAA